MNRQEPSGRVIVSLVSVFGLLLVWGIVWANLPSKDELLSAQSQQRATVAPVVPELDLTIPGIPTTQPTSASIYEGAEGPAGFGELTASETTGTFPIPSDGRARQINCRSEV